MSKKLTVEQTLLANRVLTDIRLDERYPEFRKKLRRKKVIVSRHILNVLEANGIESREDLKNVTKGIKINYFLRNLFYN
jgi:hypothetical protein